MCNNNVCTSWAQEVPRRQLRKVYDCLITMLNTQNEYKIIQDVSCDGKQSYKRTPTSNMSGVAPATSELWWASHWTLPKKCPEAFAPFFRWDYDGEIFVFKI